MRHQIAKLFLQNGWSVLFFEKPLFFWNFRVENIFVGVDLEVIKTKQLLHHRLRIFSILNYINSYYEKKSIQRALRERLESIELVINFNYDYFFLRDFLGNKKIITIINDDFINSGGVFSNKFKKTQSMTCSISDAVLGVSTPILNFLPSHSNPEIFLPWSDDLYTYPKKRLAVKRNKVLLWGYLHNDIDFQLIGEASKELKDFEFLLVGPINKKCNKIIRIILNSNENIKAISATKLKDLPLEECCAGIHVYKSRSVLGRSISMSNKTLKLAAYGIPIVTYGVENFIKHAGIINSKTLSEFIKGIRYSQVNFYSMQKGLRHLVDSNQGFHRYSKLCEIVKIKEGVNVFK